MQRCIYCEGRNRRDPNFSLEHIWPAKLGGAALPDRFKTRDVCRGCNSILGQWADGMFLKSWILQAENTFSSMRFLDPNTPGILPLFYMGIDQGFPFAEGEVCERWIGPAGAHIYHIHLADDDRWMGFAGGDFVRRQRYDPGRAYIVLTTQSQYWALCALLSFVNHFGSDVRCRSATRLGGDPLNIGVLNADEEPISAEERDEVAFILDRNTCATSILPMRIDFAERFACKLALGLGHTLLGAKVSGSAYATTLRNGMWAQTPAEREGLALRGTSFWQPTDERVKALASWPGAWVISFLASLSGFGYVIFTPEGRQFGMMMSDEPELWPGDALQVYSQGVCYVVVPQRATAIGPVPLVDLVSFRTHGIARNESLAKLAAMEVTLSDLPLMRNT